MAVCGHHYPVEGCHECWSGMEELLREKRAVIRYMRKRFVPNDQEFYDMLDEVEEAEKKRAEKRALRAHNRHGPKPAISDGSDTEP